MKRWIPFSHAIACAILLICGLNSFTNFAWAQDAAKPGTILDSTSSYWRVFYCVRAPVVRQGAALTKLPILTDDTPAPDSNWAQPDFNDSQWSRVAGKPLAQKGVRKDISDAGITDNEGSSPALAVIFMRGKFGVSHPADLKLSLGYRGGVIVYVNGKEIGRANMAKDTNGLDAVADDYPREAFLQSDGSPEIKIPRNGSTTPIPTFTARARTTEITIPAKTLRQGTNILAIEIHRAPYLAEMNDWIVKKKLSYQLYGMIWATCGLNSLTLQSDSPAGIVSNIARPKGVQIWNSQPMQADMDLDYGDPFEPLSPIVLVGSRNGVCSGKVVVGSDQAITGLSATISGLSSKGGGSIPASAIHIRYAIPTGEEPVLEDHYSALPDLLDGLSEIAPPTINVRTKPRGTWSFGAVCPVWVTVDIPEKATPGDYAAKLTISAQNQKFEVPVNLRVCNWVTPSPSQFHTVLDIMQSPETVAMQYNVPIYSDQHFKLLEKSLDRAGYIGSWTLHIPLICHTNLGNEQTMVRWIKQPGGGYKFDFTPLDKYLDLAEKHMGKPRAVDLVVWDLFLGLTGLEEAPHFIEHNTNLTSTEPEDIPVSMLDETSGAVTMGTVGRYDEKGKANWKALSEQLMDRLKKRGLEKSLHLGHSYDLCPTDAIVNFWNDLLPGVHYFRYGHYDYRTFGKTPYGISDFIVHEWAPTWSSEAAYGWKNPVIDLPWIRLRSDRGVGTVWKADPYVTVPVDLFRLFGEACIQSSYRGFGRMGLDFWPVLDNAKGQKNALGIQGRYPNSSWRQSDEMILCIVPPGPDGALSSSKLEILREGLQETEARIYLEGVLTDPAKKAALPAGLAAKVQAVLDARVRALQMLFDKQPISGFGGKPEPSLDGYSFGGMFAMKHSAIFQQWFMESGWQSRSADIYNAAGDVAVALGAK